MLRVILFNGIYELHSYEKKTTYCSALPNKKKIFDEASINNGVI
jgi:hypothetical protein